MPQSIAKMWRSSLALSLKLYAMPKETVGALTGLYWSSLRIKNQSLHADLYVALLFILLKSAMPRR